MRQERRPDTEILKRFIQGEIIVMNKRIILTTVVLFAISSSVALADDCTWTPRGGTLHGACKDQAGNPYCLTCPAGGGSCSKVPCPTPASGSGQ
jgi:hypothetical protein